MSNFPPFAAAFPVRPRFAHGPTGSGAVRGVVRDSDAIDVIAGVHERELQIGVVVLL